MEKGAEGGNGERRNVKAAALEVILAGNLSYHSDLVKALQQPQGKRERESQSRGLCCLSLSKCYMAVYLTGCMSTEAH